ncbi:MULTISPECIES: PEP-CTERM sorting domain-containing protein [Cyanophyceae]|uniref:PEP-CTERM sorting domain-containing protein n=1 Tax=Cyanophyceae TaxID=3028117 RepID=UPI0016861935|nr:PEP-CTERM sorting domain-containing protein [Trichocoleus sp. FACHB-40]MBD2006027.1 PEP-CTERM sorting domain-containing protein [Trichocoleus sp. FACHB-40]
MKLHLSLPAALMGLCLSLVVTGEAQAASFTFTKIADNSGSFSSFFEAPVINNQGTVAFRTSEGIFTGNGETITTISNTTVSSQSAIRAFSDISINDEGSVAFNADLEPIFIMTGPESGIQIFRKGIFTSNGTTTNIIRELATDGRTRVTIDSPSINNQGTVAFSYSFLGTSESDDSTVVTTNGTTTTTIARGKAPNVDDTLGLSVESNSLNDQGIVAFRRGLSGGGSGIFTGNGTTTTTIADTNGIFSNVGAASINNEGTVAFNADLDAGGEGIFTGNGTTTNTIADTSGIFSNFGAASINDAGIVAFLAGLDAGGTGIFTGSNPLTDKVISTGDTLFGSTVTSLGFFREGLNNPGQVAFFASLADGTTGIFRADHQGVPGQPPKDVPEPASMLGLLAFGTFGAFVKRRK